jgi:hypothetical protein
MVLTVPGHWLAYMKSLISFINVGFCPACGGGIASVWFPLTCEIVTSLSASSYFQQFKHSYLKSYFLVNLANFELSTTLSLVSRRLFHPQRKEVSISLGLPDSLPSGCRDIPGFAGSGSPRFLRHPWTHRKSNVFASRGIF